MKTRVIFTEPRQKAHGHPVHPKDKFCRECGESLMEVREFEVLMCLTCRVSLGETDKFCRSCGVAIDDTVQEQYVFLGVPVGKQGYQAIQAHMRGKAHSLLPEGKGWAIRFQGETEALGVAGLSKPKTTAP